MDSGRDYVDLTGPEPIKRVRPTLAGFDKTTIAADGVDEAVLSGIPDPCTVLIDGQPHEITGNELRISSTTTASYRVAIDHWPHMPFRAVVTAA